MAEIIYEGTIKSPNKTEENRIKQGDYVFCRGSGGASDFWGVYSSYLECVISLNGAGSQYVKGEELYLDDTYSYWTIEKRIKCNDARVTIAEN